MAVEDAEGAEDAEDSERAAGTDRLTVATATRTRSISLADAPLRSTLSASALSAFALCASALCVPCSLCVLDMF